MLFNSLSQSKKRTIITCNHNFHINSKHPDRILKVHDLLYIEEGEWSVSQDQTDYTLKKGDVMLLQSGHHHYGNIPCSSAVKTMFIHFSSHPNDILDECTERKDFYIFPTVVHGEGEPLIEKYFRHIIRAFWSGEQNSNAKASAYLELLLCAISSIDIREYSIANEIKKTIVKTPNRFISNEEFAHQFGCSVRTVTSKFKETTGKSLHAWQMEQKCRIAEELIRTDPTITLKEVAATYGFYDEYHFGKCFKRVMGRTPKSSKNTE